MKKIYIISFVFFMCFIINANEKENEVLLSETDLSVCFFFNQSYSENKTSDNFIFFTAHEKKENYAAKNKKKNSIPQYKRYRRLGIGLFIPGTILFVSSFILMGVGTYLILYSEQSRYRSYRYSYYYEYYGTTGNAYSTAYETVYPHRTAGIIIASFGVLFFGVGLGLFIPGIVNMAKASKYRKKRSELFFNRCAFDLNYNPFNENINFVLKYNF